MFDTRKEPRLAKVSCEKREQPIKRVTPQRQWRIFIKDLTIHCFIGIYPNEYEKKQPITLNITCDYQAPIPEYSPDIEQVVCYDDLVEKINEQTQKEHIYFVENLVESIADSCLQDARIQQITIRVDKQNVGPKAASIGIEITRHRSDYYS